MFHGVAGDVWCVVLSSFVIMYRCESVLFVLWFALLGLINFLFMNIYEGESVNRSQRGVKQL
jgi:hypothetical protein